LSYQHAFEELIKKAVEYRSNEEHEGYWSMKASELEKIQIQISDIHYKSVMFNEKFGTVRKTMMDTFSNQLKEYLTSVNNAPNYGLDDRLPSAFKELHSRVDYLLQKIDNTKS